MSPDLDYSKFLENYDPKLVSEARNMARDSLARYVVGYEGNNPRLYEFYKNLLFEKLDMFALEMIDQGIIKDPVMCRDFVDEKSETLFWKVNSKRDYLKPVTDRYSRKGEVSYEIACGSNPLFASLIHENVGDRSNIFLVDPTIYAKREPKFREYGVRLYAYVEDFKKKGSDLVAKVFRSSQKDTVDLKVPQANVAYLVEALEFLNSSPEKPLNAEVDKNGILPFVSGINEIIRDDGKLVLIDYNNNLSDALPKFNNTFKLHEYRDLVNVKFPDANYRLREFVLVKRS